MVAVQWVLAVDVGMKKTGLAVGQSLTKTAKALTVLRLPAEDLHGRALRPFITEWQVSALVFGWPELQDGRPHLLQTVISRLAKECQQEFALPVHFFSEYLSSHEAAKRAPHGKNLDAFAAAVIAEDWLVFSGRVE